MDINNIDLGSLDKEELEKVKRILEIKKVQAEIEAMIEMNELKREQHRLNLAIIQANMELMHKDNEWNHKSHWQNLETMREDSERYRAEIQAQLEQMRKINDQYFTKTAKSWTDSNWFHCFLLLWSILVFIIVLVI